MRGPRPGPALVLLALAALAVAASFLLAGVAARKPVVEPDSVSSRGGMRGCAFVPGTTCGPAPEPAWVGTGARIGVEVAGVLLVTAAGLWLRERTRWRPR
ncbi:hypothetical protein [Actinophytocola glycyrrhizae]|uniref:Uncharacterized protein n=1 Tax=Actinophytocola glycyrrhizae TaxID=2044873 RepID=A0ABV9SAZ8_9PSEU